MNVDPVSSDRHAGLGGVTFLLGTSFLVDAAAKGETLLRELFLKLSRRSVPGLVTLEREERDAAESFNTFLR